VWLVDVGGDARSSSSSSILNTDAGWALMIMQTYTSFIGYVEKECNGRKCIL
jgi:hypothetical protein